MARIVTARSLVAVFVETALRRIGGVEDGVESGSAVGVAGGGGG